MRDDVMIGIFSLWIFLGRWRPSSQLVTSRPHRPCMTVMLIRRHHPSFRPSDSRRGYLTFLSLISARTLATLLLPSLLVLSRAATFLPSRTSAFFLLSVQARRPLCSAGRGRLVTRAADVYAGGASLRRPWLTRSKFGMSSSASSTSAGTTSFRTMTPPPVAERDETRVVHAGAPPPGWDPDLPRQSEDSPEPLLDPPVPIPDPYGWMRDEKRTDERVLSHLKAENAYTEGQTAHLKDLRESLYQEMLGSIQETDYTTPRPNGKYAYYTRTYQGKAYTVYCRAPVESFTTGGGNHHQWDGSIDKPVLENEIVLLDVNELAKDQPYCDVSMRTSPSHNLLAYAADYSGNEMCGLYVQDVESGQIIDHDPDLVVYGSLRWGFDDTALFYLKMDATQRPYQLWRRTIGSSSEPDQLLYEEPNELFWMGIHKSMDDKFLFMEVSSKETSEIWYLDLTKAQDEGGGALQCVAPRRDKVLYEVEHKGGTWWIASNVGGLPNFAVFTSPAVPDSAPAWTLVTDASSTVLFDGGYDQSVDAVTCFENHVVVTGRQGGLPRVWVLGGISDGANGPTTVAAKERLTFDEDAYDVALGTHYEYSTTKVVVTYDSMITPPQSLEIDMYDTAQRTVLKTKTVPGYDRSRFDCHRTFVTSRDGKTEIPVSMVYRRDVMDQHQLSKEPVHVHLYGYGSYGSCTEADWRATRLPLLNRGMVYVQAHVRGGGEMGRQWYEEPNGAKYLCKKNTFHDFVDVANWLVHDEKLTSPHLLSCEGRSAGGMLIGASVNEAPHLFRAAILGVPFVDVVCTMIDASIPLTTAEWAEWGNPNESKFFHYMMEYCPMQNVKAGVTYPSCLLTGGLHDPRVQYWEVSKFTATLRHHLLAGADPNSPTDEQRRIICCKIDMTAGHFSASDRYKYLRELSFDFAFLLDQVGLAS